MNRRRPMMGRCAASLVLAGAATLFASRADAFSMLDATASAGVLQRELSNTSYKPAFVWQLNGDIAFLPFLMMGPYITFQNATADVPGADTSNAFRTIGARLKLKLPIPGNIQPYAVGGAGWAHGDFADQTLTVCKNGVCGSKVVPSATANFAEFLVGGGIFWTPVFPLAVTAEFNWRPTTGYTNDVYDEQIQSGSTSAPSPGRNGVAWVGLVGLGISL